AADCPLAIRVLETIDRWLVEFGSAERSIASWSVVVETWLKDLYHPAHHVGSETAAEEDGDRHEDLDSDDPTSVRQRSVRQRIEVKVEASVVAGKRTKSAVDSVLRLVQRFAALNDRLDLKIAGGAALEMLAGRLADVRVADTARPEDVEILGWLDLALDDSDAMVVVGLNHPFVPGAVTSDPFLPGTLRTKLRMADNDRRYARDVYAMQVMLSCRKDMRFIVGRTAADRSPTPPSRLLAATDTAFAARRVRHLLGGQRERVDVEHQWDDGPEGGLLPIPPLPELGTSNRVATMSVTAFRDYLACPYRFYLRHVLKLKPLDDSNSELAANQFGDLIHGALETFGQSEERNEPDRATIENLLLQHLHDYVALHYGDAMSSAVTLQVAQAERRLKAVAKQQAARVAAGWEIFASEASVGEKEKAGIIVDQQQMNLRGRFDRIDYHKATDRWAILDYKTHGHLPEKKHLKKVGDKEQWIDLQLPLYRMMIPFLQIDGNPKDVELGYFNISEKDDETKINIAQFSEPQMDQAKELIEDCIRGIWAEDFEPTADRVQFDDYGMILQSGVASRLLDQTESLLSEEPV
ncbi:MAG: PD-(D/E)XK nuclease family protein, partial [Rubripirellula sp.]